MKAKRKPQAKLELTFTEEAKEYLHEGIPVLQTALTVPVFGGLAPRVRTRLNQYYQLLLRERVRYAEKVVYPKAVQAFEAALAEGRLMRPWSLNQRCTVTLNDAQRGLLSLYTELTERGRNEPVVLRCADTFSLRDGWPEPVVRLREWMKTMRECRRTAKQAGIASRVFRRFRSEHSYLTPEGRTVFFQAGDIAPPERGVVELLLVDKQQMDEATS